MAGPFLIGLTGSIGMGKSTTARMFADEGAAVWDADAAVHRLYARGGAAVSPIGAVCPDAVTSDGISRDALKDWIARDPGALPRIEAIVHPLVAQDRQDFVKTVTADIVVFDIPLLFETGAAATMDATVVVTAPEQVQRDRVLARPGMTDVALRRLLAKQIPDSEKRARADFVVETTTMDAARVAVQDIVAGIRRKRQDA